jgi:NADH:ubiquinone oxidoreductase subunit 3 (subunit A)
MFFEYTFILKYFFLCLFFVLVLYLISFSFVYHQFLYEKGSSYECGFNPFGDARNKFEVKFYLIAILFIIFDLELTFLLL